MFRATVEVTDPGLIDAYVYQLRHAEDVTNVIVNRAVNDASDVILGWFRQEPGEVSYRIQWKSEKQRRAFFATDGFGGGIPYRRRSAPNRMVDQWRLIVVYEPGRLTSLLLENNASERQFVTGQNQQPFHMITGWYREEPLIDRAQKYVTTKVETALIKSFYAVEEY